MGRVLENPIPIRFWEREMIAKDIFLLRFALPNANQMLGFKTCEWISLMLENSNPQTHQVEKLY